MEHPPKPLYLYGVSNISPDYGQSHTCFFRTDKHLEEEQQRQFVFLQEID